MFDEVLLLIIFTAALGFGFSNGMNDAANAVAAAVGSRSISLRNAIVLAAIGNLAGAYVGATTGAAVAKTIGKGIISAEAVTGDLGYSIVIGAILAAIIWAITATQIGLPISVSHSLISGLVGAGLASGSDIGWGKFSTTLSAVITAPLLGFVGAFVLVVILFWVFRKYAPDRVRNNFKRLQYITTGFLSYAHGNNDGQMPIALMVMGLVLYTGNVAYWEDIPWGIILAGAASISLGTAVGGWRVIQTIGMRMTSLESYQAFVANLSAAGVIEIASHLGIPVSTTHCSVSSVIGVGAANRLSAVRWGVTRNITWAWILTFPICIGTGLILTLLLKQII
ncbi:anion permease [Chloroflexota bacterium]